MSTPHQIAREERARNSTDPAELRILAGSFGTSKISWLVAGNPNIDDDTVALLITEDSTVRGELAKNQATGPRHIEVLMRDYRMRPHLAQRVGDPDLLRAVYVRGHDDEVIAWLSQNPSTPLDVLHWIANDQKAYRRIALAHAVRGPLAADILEKLAEDRNPKVRYEATRMFTLLAA